MTVLTISRGFMHKGRCFGSLVAVLAFGCNSSSSTNKTIFITRLTYDGNLGGLAGADAKCQTAADAVALGGQWRAWLSTSTTPAIDRVTSNDPYMLVDGTKVFTNKTNWTTLPLAPIQKGEDGSQVFPMLSGGCPGSAGGPCVWTATDVGGQPLPDNCGDWGSNGGAGPAGTVGSLVNTDQHWTFATNLPCNNQAHLYCFEL